MHYEENGGFAPSTATSPHVAITKPIYHRVPAFPEYNIDGKRIAPSRSHITLIRIHIYARTLFPRISVVRSRTIRAGFDSAGSCVYKARSRDIALSINDACNLEAANDCKVERAKEEERER